MNPKTKTVTAEQLVRVCRAFLGDPKHRFNIITIDGIPCDFNDDELIKNGHNTAEELYENTYKIDNFENITLDGNRDLITFTHFNQYHELRMMFPSDVFGVFRNSSYGIRIAKVYVVQETLTLYINDTKVFEVTWDDEKKRYRKEFFIMDMWKLGYTYQQAISVQCIIEPLVDKLIGKDDCKLFWLSLKERATKPKFGFKDAPELSWFDYFKGKLNIS